MEAGAHLVHVTGEFDKATADEFERVVERTLLNGTSRLVVDLTATTFLDSSALAALVHSSRRLRGEGCALVVVATQAQPIDKFDLSGTRSFFHLCETTEEALDVPVIEPVPPEPAPAARPASPGPPPAGDRIELRLYLNGRSHHAVQARAAADELLDVYLPPNTDLRVIDVAEQPEIAEAERILATPMLARVAPKPVRKIVGDLADVTAVVRALELVDRRAR